ncbi:hypothetical protein BB558_001006 [Smittium angustum]|uniref:Nudix hydrolase domain-containing protein n=1 Tax=Smittium angustum TaxID=133377 RepID=A0A2U1JCK7_SMIAN|nr:hypothetical protein BB558_001006 [Smittium angustum]
MSQTTAKLSTQTPPPVKLIDSASLILTAPILDKNEIETSGYNYRVLMAKSGSFSSAHVYPGGKLDELDGSEEWNDYVDSGKKVQPNSHFEGTKINQIGEDETQKFRVCAIRETFEETGFLAGSKIIKREPSSGGKRGGHNERELLDQCKSKDAVILTSRLSYFSRWITPPHMKKRFDTKFFMFNISDSDADSVLIDQIYLKQNGGSSSREHDSKSMIAQFGELMFLDWRTPGEFMESIRKDELVLYPPQYYQMKLMSRFFKWQDLQEFARNSGPKRNVDIPLMPFFNKGLEPNSGIITLPGDHMYLKPLDKQIDLIEGGDQSKPLHRIKLRNTKQGFKDLIITENLGIFPEPTMNNSDTKHKL